MPQLCIDISDELLSRIDLQSWVEACAREALVRKIIETGLSFREMTRDAYLKERGLAIEPTEDPCRAAIVKVQS